MNPEDIEIASRAKNFMSALSPFYRRFRRLNRGVLRALRAPQNFAQAYLEADATADELMKIAQHFQTMDSTLVKMSPDRIDEAYRALGNLLYFYDLVAYKPFTPKSQTQLQNDLLTYAYFDCAGTDSTEKTDLLFSKVNDLVNADYAAYDLLKKRQSALFPIPRTLSEKCANIQSFLMDFEQFINFHVKPRYIDLGDYHVKSCVSNIFDNNYEGGLRGLKRLAAIATQTGYTEDQAHLFKEASDFYTTQLPTLIADIKRAVNPEARFDEVKDELRTQMPYLISSFEGLRSRIEQHGASSITAYNRAVSEGHALEQLLQESNQKSQAPRLMQKRSAKEPSVNFDELILKTENEILNKLRDKNISEKSCENLKQLRELVADTRRQNTLREGKELFNFQETLLFLQTLSEIQNILNIPGLPLDLDLKVAWHSFVLNGRASNYIPPQFGRRAA